MNSKLNKEMGSFEYAKRIAECAGEYFRTHPWFGLNLKPKIQCAIYLKNPVEYNIACHIQSLVWGAHHELSQQSVIAFTDYFNNIVEKPVSKDREDDFKRGVLSGFVKWVEDELLN